MFDALYEFTMILPLLPLADFSRSDSVLEVSASKRKRITYKGRWEGSLPLCDLGDFSRTSDCILVILDTIARLIQYD